jgi:hypothetical protein
MCRGLSQQFAARLSTLVGHYLNFKTFTKSDQRNADQLEDLGNGNVIKELCRFSSEDRPKTLIVTSASSSTQDTPTVHETLNSSAFFDSNPEWRVT